MNVPDPEHVRGQLRLEQVEQRELGAVPMEDVDLVVSPASRQLVVNPESPNIPRAPAK